MHAFDAIFEHGILRPLVPQELAEGQIVRVVIDFSSAPAAGSTPSNEGKHEALDWSALRGVAPGLTGMDAQQWVNQERKLWDRRIPSGREGS